MKFTFSFRITSEQAIFMFLICLLYVTPLKLLSTLKSTSSAQVSRY